MNQQSNRAVEVSVIVIIPTSVPPRPGLPMNSCRLILDTPGLRRLQRASTAPSRRGRLRPLMVTGSPAVTTFSVIFNPCPDRRYRSSCAFGDAHTFPCTGPRDDRLENLLFISRFSAELRGLLTCHLGRRRNSHGQRLFRLLAPMRFPISNVTHPTLWSEASARCPVFWIAGRFQRPDQRT